MAWNCFLIYFSSLVSFTFSATAPNIIFILADDLGWDDVGFHGSEQVPTPNIDALAYDGIILNNYYVQPICTPSRSALLTGKHPVHLGLQHGVITVAQPYGLDLKEKVLPEYLLELGYKTHMVGKWHIGSYAWNYTPTFRGFQSHFGYFNGKEDYWDHTNGHGNDKFYWGLDLWNQTTPVKDRFGSYSTEIFTQRAEEIILKHDDSNPLFLYLPHQAVHSANSNTPLQAPWKYLKHFSHIKNEKRRIFAAMTSVLDDSIKNITVALAKKGLLNNTIIAFSTDNGGPAAGFDLNMACNWPLRGVKRGLFEGGVRGAGFIWSPLLKNSGYVSNHMMQIFDWLPTLLNPAGYKMSRLDRNIDGVDMWPALANNLPASPRLSMLHNIDENNFAFRKGDMKIIQGHFPWQGWYEPGQPASESESKQIERFDAIINDTTWKTYIDESPHEYQLTSDLRHLLKSIGRTLNAPKPVKIHCGEKPDNASTNCQSKREICLYNITSDPCEYNNLNWKYPAIVSELMFDLRNIMKTVVSPRNKPLDKKGLPGNFGGIWMPWM